MNKRNLKPYINLFLFFFFLFYFLAISLGLDCRTIQITVIKYMKKKLEKRCVPKTFPFFLNVKVEIHVALQTLAGYSVCQRTRKQNVRNRPATKDARGERTDAK